MENATILPRIGGLFVYAKSIPEDAYIEFWVEFNGEIWTSEGREVQTIEIELQRRENDEPIAHSTVKDSYRGDNYWDWSVWLEGPASELDQIKYAEYRLDPTFPGPVRRVADRESQFKLSSAGWGGFTLYAKAIFRDGSRLPISYPLRHYRPVEEPASR